MKANPVHNLQEYVESLVTTHQIPAVSLAIWQDSQLYQAAAGCLNLHTGVAATPDSIFQIGSITKPFTASLIMQLVDEGRLELDQPVKSYLRDFQVADPDATQSITVRQLLNHTNGLMGDFFPNDAQATGNPIARYVDRCNLLPQIHPPGKFYSYSNAAYGIAGRLIEVVLGMSWFEAIEERIFQPLEMTHAVAKPTELLRHRVAAGHILNSADTNGSWILSPTSHLTMGLAAAGSSLTLSAADLIQFAKAHLWDGCGPSGNNWLSPNAVKRMQENQIKLPLSSSVYDFYAGIGWKKSVMKKSDAIMVGHTGATKGFCSTLQFIPTQNLAFAILVNGVKAGVLPAIQKDLLCKLCGTDCREPELKPLALDKSKLNLFTGIFESFDRRCAVNLADDQLLADITHKIDPLPPATLLLTPIEENCFATTTEEGECQPNLIFFYANKSDKKPMYLHAGGRIHVRSENTASHLIY